ncbi:MAG: NAD(P)-dependent oxidoreductase [Deltaproteobacteria bacterium]|jgi:nucleoside-diphosphate-sugar epimerase|nr:NAD(P)-dependent oxidoreductase [Deltaproteobacteria bacterium]
MKNSKAKIKLLVTGASGFIGQEVARQLSVGGYRPRLMIRQAADDCEICHLDADFVMADLRNLQSLKQAVKDVDGIVHLAARATFESYETLKPSILDGSLALMEAGITAGVRRFVYSSSLLVYGPGESCVNADTPVDPVLDYGRIKVKTEKRLSEMAASAGVHFTALRLPHVYGVRDLYFSQLRAGRLILPGLGKNIYTHLHVSDAARAIIACAEQDFSGILPFGDRRPSTWSDFLKIARPHYPDARVYLMPQWLALMATAVLTPFRGIRSNPGLETPGAVRTYNFNLAVDPDLLWKDLGMEPRYPTIFEGIPAVAAGLPDLELLQERIHMA